MAKILITGSCGLLGSHLMVALTRRHAVVGIDRHSWWGDQLLQSLQGDLTVPEYVEDVVRSTSPQILIHCAGMVNVDACERDPRSAALYNAAMTRNLVQAVPRECLVVYISTDGLFKGDTPFVTEEEPPCPLTVYARSKLEGEWAVQQATEHHLIVRTNFYGWFSGRKETAAEWLYRSLETRQPITLFRDFFFSPIYVTDFIERLIRLMEGGQRGIIHVAGRDRLSKYEFGRLMAVAANLSLDYVREGSIDDAPLLARRPKDMSLSSDRFVRLTGIDVPDTESGLQRFLADRRRPLSARVAAGETQRASVR